MVLASDGNATGTVEDGHGVTGADARGSVVDVRGTAAGVLRGVVLVHGRLLPGAVVCPAECGSGH
ncbi:MULTISPECIES: hypothetical protein [Streptomyces]|uniref:hypothetical protein n=1 Tax=Streptomyces TaxID=1883 RepID=UPI0003A80ECD|nr:hypothetical protein [Streptomyces sp. PAMC 26508]